MFSKSKTRASFLALVIGILALLSLGSQSFADTQKIVFGIAPGPYGDLIKLAIAPGLEKKHYTVEVTEFSDYVQPDLALANKSIDVNVFQHRVYLDKFSADHGLKLSPVITIPTASLGIYSKKFKSLSDIKDGATITIANDPTNLARALRYLQALGLITINPNIDASKASEKDIAENPKHLNIEPVEAAQLPRTLDSVDFSLVNGNYAIASGIWPTALGREILTENYINLVAVRTEDLDKPFVKDIVAVVKSKAFLDAVNDPKNGFTLFQKPEWLKAQSK